VLILGLFSAASIFASQKTTWGVQRVLINAIVGERAAIARYEAFAVKADAEGYLGVADLFRAAARAERVHLDRFTSVANERGLALPASDSRPPIVGSTRENLDTAIRAELAERDDVYLDAFKTSTRDADEGVAKVFDQTRDAEVEHANLCQNAARNLDAMKEHKAYYVCPVCGYTTDVHLPMCPSCRHSMR
jgi:rubrerythrin